MENQKNIFSTLVLEQNPSYVEELEKKYNIELPPIFKAFVQTFEFGKFEPTPKHRILHSNEKIGYDGFELTLEKYIQVYQDQDDLYINEKLLPIAVSGFYHFGICLGIGKDNTDKIILFEHNYDNGLTLIANNILEFISQLKEVHWDSF